jgi:hypothetical protein
MVESVPISPAQEQLFNLDQLDQATQDANETYTQAAADAETVARRTAVAENVYTRLTSANQKEVSELEPLDEQEVREGTLDAISLLKGNQDNLPEGMRLQRDWADNEKEHKEKQVEYNDTMAHILQNSLNATDRKQVLRDNAKHETKMRETMAEDASEREAIKEEYLAKKRLDMGKFAFNNPLNREDIERDANRAVSDHYSSKIETLKVETGKGTSVSTKDLKDETEKRKQAAKANQQANSDSLSDFQRGFKAPEAKDDTQKMDKPEDDKDVDQTRLEMLTEDFINARDEYALIATGRGRRVITTFKGGFSKKNLAVARERFEEAEASLYGYEISQKVQRNMFESDTEFKNALDVESRALSAENEWSLATSLYEHRLVASGSGEFDAYGNFEEKSPKGRARLMTNNFRNWFTNRKDKKIQKDIWNPRNDVIEDIIDSQSNREVLRNRTGVAFAIGAGAVGALLIGDSAGLEHILGHGARHSHNLYTGGHNPIAPNHGGNGLGPNHFRLGNGNGVHHTTSSHAAPNHAPKPGARNGGSHQSPNINAGGHIVNGNNIQGKYVSTVYENQLGLHNGFTNMEHAARLAQHAHELSMVQDPSNPLKFFYETANGHTDTESVLKVLAKYGGKVKVS